MGFEGNWIDLLIIAGVLVFLIDGVRAGAISEVFELIGFFVSLVIAFLFFSKVGAIFTHFFPIPESFALAAGFLLTWLISESTYFLAAKALYNKIPSAIIGNFINRFGSIIPSIVNGFVFWAFLLILVVALPVPSNFKSDIFSSKIGNFLISQTSQLEKPLQKVFAPAVSDIQKSLTFLTIVPESRERVNLNFTQTEFKVDSESEEKMLALVNKERTEMDLRALVFDSRLREVARTHSRDMFARGYFGHFSPEGKDAGDRLTGVGTTFVLAGENLAYAPNVVRAHDGLIDSPGHRANILQPEFGKVGIGVIDGGIYGKMFTQVFTD